MINPKQWTLVAASGLAVAATLFTFHSLRADTQWPPQVGHPFPDLELVDQTGRSVEMSSLKGKVLLVEFVAMSCPACQAFTGAHLVGSFEDTRPQRGLESIEKLFSKYTGGLSLNDERIVLVQLLLYNLSMGAPTAEDARKWAQHFRLDRSKNQVVLAGTKELVGPASTNLIPGFQLVDQQFIVRSDSTGHHPRHNLYTHLLPMVDAVLKETASGPTPISVDRVMALADDHAVEAAYHAIPHRRTVFDSDTARMSAQEKDHLRIFFRLVDLAIVQRVQATQWIFSKGQRGKPAQHYDAILESLQQHKPPPALANAQKLVTEAIREQRAVLDEWKKSPPSTVPRNHRRVQNASAKLHQAYSLLMGLFPQESAHNKQAFFDYLCALDFI